MRVHKRKMQLILAGALLLVAADSTAASPRKLIEQGNEAVAAERYDEAEKAYDQASVEDPESPFLDFNRGVIAYRQNDYSKAREAFEAAIPKSRDVLFEAKCRYNIGNCWYRECRRQQDSDLEKALEACKSAIESYERAARLDPDLEAAGRNLEVARLTMKTILDEIKRRQEEQKKQQQQQQKTLEELKKLIERQEKAADKTRQFGKRKPDGTRTPAGQRELADRAREQEKLREDTNSFKDQLRQQAPQPQPRQPSPVPPNRKDGPMEKAKTHLSKAVDQQNTAAKKLAARQPRPALRSQETATEELKKALAALTPPNNGQQQKQQNKQQQQQQKQQGKKGKEKGKSDQEKEKKARAAKLDDKAARDILNDEKKNRERRRVQPAGGISPVEKDW